MRFWRVPNLHKSVFMARHATPLLACLLVVVVVVVVVAAAAVTKVMYVYRKVCVLPVALCMCAHHSIKNGG
jgi:hypothetical protein